MIYEFALTNDPAQEFNCIIDRVRYLLRIKLNVRGGVWTLDVNRDDQNPIILGLPLVLGSDLLATERFAKGILFLVDYTGRGKDPHGNNLKEFGLVWSNEHGRE